MLSGSNPKEQGWIGLNLYFLKKYSYYYVFNTIKDTNIGAENSSVVRTTYLYETITKKIGKNYEIHELLSFKN